MNRIGTFTRRHANGLIALGLALATLAVLVLHAPRVGFTRDEGYYFDAGVRYAGWFRDLGKNGTRALSEPAIRRYYETNREHPVLLKNLMALSYLIFDPKPHPYDGQGHGHFGSVMRLPAHAFTALGVALLFLFGCQVASRRVGLFAAGAFLLAPRHFYHAQLACFDMPITVLWLATVMAYRKSRGSIGWSLATGVIWGLALSTKLNAFFLPAVLVLHWLLVSFRETSLSRSGLTLPRIPWAFLAMAILGPLVFWLHWPFLWHHTLERFGWYLGFHLNHVHYPWEYFGELLTDPPFPWLYPLAITAVTLPLPTLLLAVSGLLRLTAERLALFRKRPWFDKSDGWLLWLNATIPVLIIALPSVPIFGGMKHWLHAMPFWCLLAGVALDRTLDALPAIVGRRVLPRGPVFAATAGLALLPSLLGLVHTDPHGCSYYNAVIGGVPGAASAGLQRQYWSNNVSGVLPWINEHVPQHARIYFHEVNTSCIQAYQRDGFLRQDIQAVGLPEQADFTAYQFHREFVNIAYRAWQKAGRPKVIFGAYLDEVPLVQVIDSRKDKETNPVSR